VRKFAFLFAALTFSGSAFAADMAVKAPPPPPVVAPAYSWTGFYLGIVGGGGWGDTQHTNAISGGNSGPSGIGGGLFGGTYGYNWQSGAWVFGLEGDFSWSGIQKGFQDNNGSLFCEGTNTCETDLRWFGTDRGRLGYAWDRFLVYASAGVAYGDVRGTLSNAPFVQSFTVGDSTRAGFTFGGGIEWALAHNWSVKAEYLHTDFGNKITYDLIAGGSPEEVSLTHLDIVRAGLNYRFGGN
jgi:outer membrane immunogenic protein